MPAIPRSIIAGPALITYDSVSFWSKGDVVLKVVNDLFNIDTAHFGKVDERFAGRRIEVEFEPSGAFSAAVAAVLWPYGSTTVGSSIFTGTDKPLAIFGRDGRKVTVHAAALTKMPPIRLAVNQTIAGSCQFTGICAANTDPTNAAAFYTEAAVAYPGDTGFAVSDILTKHCTAVWGVASPWNSFLTEGGWVIDFNLGLAPQNVDGIGVVDMTFQQLEVTAKAIPVGPTAANIMAKVSPAVALGTSVASADELVISGPGVGDPEVVLSAAAIVDSGLAYGNTVKRVTETTWIATRTITGGTADALFIIAEII